MTSPAKLTNSSHEFPMDIAKSVQTRMKQLSPSVEFDQLWSDLQQTDSTNSRKRKRQSALRRWSLRVIAAVLLVLLMLGVSFTSPAVRAAVEKIPFIKLLTKQEGVLFDRGLEQIEQQQLSESTNLTATDKDITMTITDVFYDGIQIALGYEVRVPSTKKLTDKDAAVYYQLNIEEARPPMSWTHSFAITDDHTFAGTTLISTAPLPDHPHVRMHVDRIGEVKGNWNFTIPLRADKTAASTKRFHPNVKATIGDENITVKEIISTPVTTRVIIESDKRPGNLGFSLQDDLGTYIMSAGGMGDDENRYILDHSPFSSINPNPAHLTLLVRDDAQTVYEITGQKEVYADYTGQFPVTMEGPEGGTIQITNVELLTDRTLVHYESSDAMNQLPFLMLEDSDGKRYVHKNSPVRVSRDTFSFVMEYPKLDSTSGLKFMIPIDQYANEPKKPIEVNIPLEW